MQSNYRDSKNDLVQCPFNPAHKVKKCRLITHKKICPDKDIKGFVQCPFNPSHIVTVENLERHKAKCPSKVVINSELEKEMQEFIKNKKNNFISDDSNKESKKEKISQKENIPNNLNEIEGLNSKKSKIKKNKKEPKTQKEDIKEKAIDFETITNKELFNFIFNDNMVIEYHSDSSENNDEIMEKEDNM